MNISEYKAFLENVPKYYTLQEKDACIQLLDTYTSVDIAKILGLSPGNNLEAIAMIFQARKKSVSEIIEVKSLCPSCNTDDFYFIDIDNMFFRDIEGIDTSIPVKLIDDIDDIDDIDTQCAQDINNLSIDEFNELENIIIHNNKCIFDNTVSVQCKKCQNTFDIRINYTDIISKFTIKNIYEQYLDMTQFTNMTKYDVDKMPPFEREIFIGLIQERENKKE